MRKLWSTALSLLMAGAVLVPLAIATAAPVELTFRFNDPEHKQMREALDDFQKQNPNIKVSLQRIGWGDARAQFLREAAVGSDRTSPTSPRCGPAAWARPAPWSG